MKNIKQNFNIIPFHLIGIADPGSGPKDVHCILPFPLIPIQNHEKLYSYESIKITDFIFNAIQIAVTYYFLKTQFASTKQAFKAFLFAKCMNSHVYR